MQEYITEAKKTVEALRQSTRVLSDKLDHVINVFKQNREMIKNAAREGIKEGCDKTFTIR